MPRDWNQMRDSIIGLGEESSRKSFYPALQQRLVQLEKTQQDLRRSEANLWIIFNSFHDAIIIHDHEGKVIEVNDAMLNLYGVTRTTFQNYSIMDYSFPLEGKPVTLAQLQEIWERLDHEDHLLLEWTARRPEDGTTFQVELTLRKAPWYSREVFLAVVRDITKRKRLEEMLSRSQRLDAIGQLAGGIAHDTNNMLSVILGYADILEEEMGLSASAQECIAKIRKAALHSSGLIRQLMAFARKQTIQPQRVDLNCLVEDTQKMLRRLISENISLVWKPSTQLWSTWVDPNQIDQILANLIVNARDAIGEHGCITLSTVNLVIDQPFCQKCLDAAPGEYVRLSVSDTGHGMTPDVQARIFEPFFTTKAAGKGTGLGLAMVYGILRQNNGFITVESAPDMGTTLHLHFPRHEDPETEILENTSTAALPGGDETILLVEDEEALIEIETKTLLQAGYRVIASSHPQMALLRIQEESGPVPLLITDIVMPELNGWELFERIQAINPDIKALFLSGYSGDILRPSEAITPGTDFLQKPFKRCELLKKVRQLLDGRPD